MNTKSAFRVGLLVALGLAAFIAGWFYLSHGLSRLSHYRLNAVFDDTQGLVKQTPIRMNGVTIGEIEDVELSKETDLKPVVLLAIENKYENSIPKDSTIQITSGLLITNAQVEITPGEAKEYYQENESWRPDKVIAPGTLLASVSPEADEALKTLTVMIKEIQPRVTKTMDGVEGILKQTQSTMSNIEESTVAVKRMVQDPKIRETMYTALNDLETVSGEAKRTATMLGTELRGMVKRNRGKVDELASLAVETLQNIGDTVDAARSAITLISQQVSDPRLQQSLVETLELSRATVARLNQIASDIHSLTGDPTVQSDIKTTLTNVKETTEQVKPVLEKVNNILGAIKPGGGPRFGIGAPGIALDFFGRTRSPGFRSDVNARFPVGEKNAFNIGVYDFAESYKLNAQYELGLSRFSSLRYGLYAGKLGAGFNWQAAPRSSISLDLYNPNNFQLDAKAIFGVNKSFSAALGVESILRRPTPVLGVRFRP